MFTGIIEEVGTISKIKTLHDGKRITINAQKVIDDLDIDSILIIELKTQFEEKYEISIDKEDLNLITSLSDIMNYLEQQNVTAK